MIQFPNAGLSQIEQLVNEARVADVGAERRVEQRYTYFRPLSVVFEDDRRVKSVSAFSRDVSLSGIGLLLATPIERTHCTLRVSDHGGTNVEVPAEVMWCRPCGEGWYLAGARFVRD